MGAGAVSGARTAAGAGTAAVASGATGGLRTGSTRFVDLPEPLLAFFRDTDDGGLLCLFNLSPDPVRLTLDHGTLVGPSQAAALTGTTLSLGPNAFAFAAASGATRLRPYSV